MAVESESGYIIIGTHLACDLLILLMTFQYHRRRHLQPIRSRIYWQAELTALLMFVASFYSACISEFHRYISCETYLVLHLLFFTSMVPILLRAAHVYSAYEVSKVYVQGGSSNYEGKLFTEGNFFLRRAEFLQSWKFQAAVIVAAVAFNTAGYLVLTQVFTATCAGMDELILAAIYGAAMTLPTLYLGWNLATLKDGLDIRKELILVAVGSVIRLPIYVGLRLHSGSYYYSNIMSAFLPMWVPLIQIGMPLYKSYVWQKHRKDVETTESVELSITGYKTEGDRSRNGSFSEVATQREKTSSSATRLRGPASLTSLLRSKEGNALFLEFARLELNHENVLFYNEVTPFLEKHKRDRKLLASQEFEDKCWQIYRKFISSNAKLEINLGAREKAYFTSAGFDTDERNLQADKALKAIHVAWAEVVDLMYRGVYPRFVRTKAYLEFAAKNASIVEV